MVLFVVTRLLQLLFLCTRRANGGLDRRQNPVFSVRIALFQIQPLFHLAMGSLGRLKVIRPAERRSRAKRRKVPTLSLIADEQLLTGTLFQTSIVALSSSKLISTKVFDSFSSSNFKISFDWSPKVFMILNIEDCTYPKPHP